MRDVCSEIRTTIVSKDASIPTLSALVLRVKKKQNIMSERLFGSPA
jgi:hypothetical protein